MANKTRFLRCSCIHIICDAFRDLISFVQFKKCVKHPWRSVTFIKLHAFSVGGVSHVFGIVQIVANRTKCLILSELFTKPVGAGIFLSFHRSFIDIFSGQRVVPANFLWKTRSTNYRRQKMI